MRDVATGRSAGARGGMRDAGRNQHSAAGYGGARREREAGLQDYGAQGGISTCERPAMPRPAIAQSMQFGGQHLPETRYTSLAAR